MLTTLKHPSAWLPIALSLSTIVFFFGWGLIFGFAKQDDEGLGAHLFWLIMGLQIPICLYFLFKWVPQFPRQGIAILSLQGALWLLAWTPVWYFQL